MVFLSTFFVKNQIYTSILAIFPLEFSSFLPQIITKNQLLFSKIKFTLVYRPFFPFKNDQKWEILTILPSTVDILGSIFDILGRFAKMPHPKLAKK